jgi:protein-S-isoprenylcysteine O-methyltransferase Ste14
MEQSFFHYAFIAVFLAFVALRLTYHRKARRTMGKAEFKEGKLHIAVRLIFGIPFLLTLVAYMFQPEILSWAALPLPAWLRWIGLVMAAGSLPLFWWVHSALGSNFSGTLHVREEHTLVTHGPYRRVRHPMYTAFYIYLLGILFLTANWFIGGFFLTGLTVVVINRLKNEESAMVEKFGDRYLEYMKHTGRFLPPISTHYAGS